MNNARRYRGPTINDEGWPKLGPYFTPPPAERGIDYSADIDFRIGDGFVWSIGRVQQNRSFEFNGTTHLIPRRHGACLTDR